jgi:thiol-activated cytolysin
MTKQLKKTALVTFLGLNLLASCSKTEDKKTSFNDLQPVAYPAKSDKVVSSVPTGRTVFNPVTGVNEFEYLTSIEKQYTLDPISVVSTSNLDVLYPGSILRGSSFLNAVYDPLVVRNSFNPVILSGTLQGNGTNFTTSVSPTLGAVRNAINVMKSQNTINYQAVPAVIEYDSEDIVNEKSYAKAFELHMSVGGLFGFLSANFDTSSGSGSSTTSRYTVVRVKQSFYNFGIDPKYYTDWINGPIDLADFGTHEPVYVSSVDYGRVAFIRIENTQTSEYNNNMVKAAVNYAIPTLSAGVSVTSTNEFKSLITNGKVKFLVVGGPVALGQQVTDYLSFKAFIQQPNAQELVSSSVPVGYKVRRLKDNTLVDVKDIYVKQIKELRSN